MMAWVLWQIQLRQVFIQSTFAAAELAINLTESWIWTEIYSATTTSYFLEFYLLIQKMSNDVLSSEEVHIGYFVS